MCRERAAVRIFSSFAKSEHHLGNGETGGLDPELETLKIETHCSERRFGWRVPEFSGWNIGLQ
jgi:hypothetical protein